MKTPLHASMDATIQKKAAYHRHRFRSGLSTCTDNRPSCWIDRGKVTLPIYYTQNKKKKQFIICLSIDIPIFLFPPPMAAHTEAVSPTTSRRWDPAA